MKLSEAIREGIKQYPVKATDMFFDEVNGVQAACAIGCAYFALGNSTGDEGPDIANRIADIYPELNEHHPHPAGLETLSSADEWTLQSEIVWRNDDLDQTREEIAQWLEDMGY